MFSEIWNYTYAVVTQWWGLIALVLGITRFVSMVFPASIPWADFIQRGRKVVISLTIAFFAIANFQLYSKDQNEIHSLKLSSFDATKLDISKLPTSIEGLRRGQVWNNGGVISIAQ